MSGVKGTIWEAAPHTIAKHEILKGYLGAWFPIMGTITGRIVYIDGFAGPGKYKSGEPGSPIIALKSAQHHRVPTWKEIKFLFIERDKRRYNCLKALVEDVKWNPKSQIILRNKSFSEFITPHLDDLESKRGLSDPTFAFVDPFGWADVPFDSIRRILGVRWSEVLVTFMIEEIRMYISVEAQRRNFTTYFGNDNWKSCIDLSKTAREQCLIETYVDNLRSLAGARHVRTFRMINQRNMTDYYLVYATNHTLGLDRMKWSMWKVGAGGDFQFSDITAFTNQINLNKPDFRIGYDQISQKFQGQTVSIEEVEKFIIEQTPFHSGNYKTPILKELMEDIEPPLIKVQGRKRQRPGEYPKGCRITFDDKME